MTQAKMRGRSNMPYARHSRYPQGNTEDYAPRNRYRPSPHQPVHRRLTLENTVDHSQRRMVPRDNYPPRPRPPEYETNYSRAKTEGDWETRTPRNYSPKRTQQRWQSSQGNGKWRSSHIGRTRRGERDSTCRTHCRVDRPQNQPADLMTGTGFPSGRPSDRTDSYERNASPRHSPYPRRPNTMRKGENTANAARHHKRSSPSTGDCYQSGNTDLTPDHVIQVSSSATSDESTINTDQHPSDLRLLHTPQKPINYCNLKNLTPTHKLSSESRDESTNVSEHRASPSTSPQLDSSSLFGNFSYITNFASNDNIQSSLSPGSEEFTTVDEDELSQSSSQQSFCSQESTCQSEISCIDEAALAATVEHVSTNCDMLEDGELSSTPSCSPERCHTPEHFVFVECCSYSIPIMASTVCRDEFPGIYDFPEPFIDLYV